MAIFRRVPPDGQKGKVSYNSGIVGKIISLAVAEIEGVEMLANKKRGLKLYFEKVVRYLYSLGDSFLLYFYQRMTMTPQNEDQLRDFRRVFIQTENRH